MEPKHIALLSDIKVWIEKPRPPFPPIKKEAIENTTKCLFSAIFKQFPKVAYFRKSCLTFPTKSLVLGKIYIKLYQSLQNILLVFCSSGDPRESEKSIVFQLTFLRHHSCLVGRKK